MHAKYNKVRQAIRTVRWTPARFSERKKKQQGSLKISKEGQIINRGSLSGHAGEYRLTVQAQDRGFPYLHGNDIWDPEFGTDNKIKEREFVKPIQELGPHVAPLDIFFYTGNMFPEFYKNQAFIAEHGSWNRSTKIGYQISIVTFDKTGKATSYQPFIKGWLQGEDKIMGRPVAFLQMPDGSVLISDDYTGTIYRVSYKG